MENTNPGTQYWTYSLVDGIPTWDELVKDEIMSIGWDELGNLDRFSSKEEVGLEMERVYDPNKKPRNDPAAAYEFVHGMKQGDIVYVRQGNQLVGRGIVNSDYQFDQMREQGKSFRRVSWERIKERPVPEGYGNKRLTNVTNYPDFIEELTAPDIKYYWVNQSKDYEEEKADGIIKAPKYLPGSSGKKSLPHWKILNELKPGDRLLSYVNKNSREQNVVAELCVLRPARTGFYTYDKLPNVEHVVVDVKYNELPKKVPLDDIKKNIRTNHVNVSYHNGPISFKVSEGYCFNSDETLHNLVLGRELPSTPEDDQNQIDIPWKDEGENILFYGVPGSGKSWIIKDTYLKDAEPEQYIRILFHPDYTYSDFIGQILPDVGDDGSVTYKFIPGPFTTIVKKAFLNKGKSYFLIIEEINRGNAPAIFGDVFQLLDRAKVDGTKHNSIEYPKGVSEYSIDQKDMATEIYGKGKENYKVFIPPNLKIIATMNTSDQNVFTLDTAFQRRWDMQLIRNTFEGVDKDFAGAEILDTGVNWETFCTQVNELIAESNTEMVADKRLGVYFVCKEDLSKNSARKQEIKNQPPGVNTRFSEKVIKYLWDDAFKFNRDVLFETKPGKIATLEKAIDEFNRAKNFQRFEKIFTERFCNLIRPNEQTD